MFILYGLRTLLLIDQSSTSTIHQSLPRHKLVYNGGFSNFELLLLVQNSIYVAQILHGLSYMVSYTFRTKSGTIKLSILILDMSSLYTSRLVAML